MSLSRHDARGGAQSAATSRKAHPTPGKRTQVELLSHPGSGHGQSAERDHDDHQKKVVASKASNPSGVDLATLQHFIAKHEGRVDHVYLDSLGFPTAGIGHLITGGNYRVGQKVSAEQVTEWFKDDVAKAIKGAKQSLGSAYDGLSEARKMVVIDMVFNLGAGGFSKFHETIHAIRTGSFSLAAERMLQSLWASQVGNRAKEDAAIMRSGHLAGGGGGGGGGQSDHGHGGGGGGGGAAHGTSLGDVREGQAVLKIGAKGPAVAKLQHLLHISADGIFGPQTLHAVEKFQRAHHLTVDGIVGTKTLHALEHKAPAKPHREHDDSSEGGGSSSGGAESPGGPGHGHGHSDKKHDGRWIPAPSLAAVKSGAAVLHQGEKGPAVKHVQRLLSVDVDGEFGPATRAAVREFERDHHMKRHDGAIDAHTLRLLTAHPPGGVEGESRNGAAQRAKMLSVARAGSAGRRPDGRCYFHVCQFFIQCGGYGKITNPYNQFSTKDLPVAHNFADLMNAGGAQRFHLERLSMSNPYDAPAGSIVVVAAGSPGTAHPTAGDIAVADGHGNFYNGGMMSYSGRAGWASSPRARLLGVYIPK